MSATRKRIRSIWTDMRRRCNNQSRPDYKWYGARGIAVCDEWAKFDSFYDWATSNGYSDDLTIDRKNVDGNYEPHNCRWATIAHQERNRRDTDHISFGGKTQCLREWARELRMHQQTLWRRLYVRNWSIDRAMSTPVGAK